MGPSLLVAFLAGCGNVLLTNPIWTVATRMQARDGLLTNPIPNPIMPAPLWGLSPPDPAAPHALCQHARSLHRRLRGLADCCAAEPGTCRLLTHAPFLPWVDARLPGSEQAAPGAQAHRSRGDTDGSGLPPGVLAVCREIYEEGGVRVRRCTTDGRALRCRQAVACSLYYRQPLAS